MFSKKYKDSELVACYLKYNSQNKAASEMGCSRESVARAVRRAGIPLNGRRNNGDHKGNGGGGSPIKLADADLIEEAKTMSREEIARKHGVHVMNVIRKEKRLGISCADGIGTGGKWKPRARQAALKNFDNDITLLGVYERDGGICQICGMPVDKNARDGRKIYRDYPTVDHIIPLSHGGLHVWDNVQLAHMGCNAMKGDNFTVEEGNA